MAKFEELYNKIEYNVKAALLQMADLRKENEGLKAEVKRLESEREALGKKVEDMEYKLKLIAVTKKILNKEDTTQTKKQINDWVREIDNCIELLKNKE